MATAIPDFNSTSTDFVSSLQASPTKDSAPSNQLGQEDFLLLLTTQLQNQDPSKPMDPTSFVTDLTQMSQLESTTQMNESIIAMTAGFQSLQTMQAAALIGKSVEAVGEEMSHVQGNETEFKLDIEEELTDIKVIISDSNGLVSEINVGERGLGETSITWDGLDNVENSVASGQYQLTAFGTDAAGELQQISTVVPSRVNSVGVGKDGSMSVTLATGEKISLGDVREISG